jgi:hypothetical protein
MTTKAALLSQVLLQHYFCTTSKESQETVLEEILVALQSRQRATVHLGQPSSSNSDNDAPSTTDDDGDDDNDSIDEGKYVVFDEDDRVGKVTEGPDGDDEIKVTWLDDGEESSWLSVDVFEIATAEQVAEAEGDDEAQPVKQKATTICSWRAPMQ